nr:hypothetical protein [Nordella sp. HKS 07]
MTMVTEEVYLSTQTRQRPWTNASLRRILAFGGKVEEISAYETLIEGERRKLLLTIAATPKETRSFVEALTREERHGAVRGAVATYRAALQESARERRSNGL